MHNLLTDTLFMVALQGVSGRKSMTLPGVLRALWSDSLDFYYRLPAHLEGPWHQFLTQVVVIVARKHNVSVSTLQAWSEKNWMQALLSLASTEAWQLVCPDQSKPAFMQTPYSRADTKDEFDIVEYPADADLFLCRRNHGVKYNRGRFFSAEEWAYLLVGRQTADSYRGRGHFSSVRMNGGMSNRVLLHRVPSTRWGARLAADVERILTQPVQTGPCAEQGDWNGPALIWTLPWCGTDSLQREELHPYFVEVQRRLRLVARGDDLVLWQWKTKVPRVIAANMHGVVGDAWAPVVPSRQVAQTFVSSTVSLTGLAALLRADGKEDIALPTTARPWAEPRAREEMFVVQILGRGMCKTDGVTHIEVPVRLIERASQHADLLERIVKKVLWPALCALSRHQSYAVTLASRHTDDFRRAVERSFRASLDAKVDDVAAIKAAAESSFKNAMKAVDAAGSLSYEKRAAAARIFYGGLKAILEPGDDSRAE